MTRNTALLLIGWSCFPVAAALLVVAYRQWRIWQAKRETALLRAKIRRAVQHESGSIDIVRAR